MLNLISKLKRAILIIGDVVILYLALYLTLWVRHWEPVTMERWVQHWVPFTAVFFIWIIILFINKLYEFILWIKEHNEITIIKKKQIIEKNNLTDKIIVFSGFRNEELKNKLETFGAKVKTSVSKKTTYLIIKGNDETNKVIDARNNNVQIIGYNEFIKKYNLF